MNDNEIVTNNKLRTSPMDEKQRALLFPIIQLVVILVSLDEPLRSLFVVVSVRETVVRRWICGGEPFPVSLYFWVWEGFSVIFNIQL